MKRPQWPLLGLVLGSLAVAPTAFGQAPGGPRRFTAATVKANVSDARGNSIDTRPGGRLLVTNHTLRNLLRIVYRVQDQQLVGGPAWVAEDRWDIVATAEANATIPEMLPMLQALLEERFKLRTHREKREMPIYVLTVDDPARGPLPGFKTTQTDCEQSGACFLTGPVGDLRAVGSTMASFQRALEGATGRVIVDKTGFPRMGLYDFTLRWRPDVLGNVNTELPSLFTALEEQLGLKLQPARAPVEVVVIDSAERPLEN